MVTHDHPEGVRGAQATAAAVWAARKGAGKRELAELIGGRFGYPLDDSIEALQQRGFDITCQGTVPAAAIAFLQSSDYEDALRNAVSIGGDTDTLACICGSISEAFYGGVPPALQQQALARLDPVLREEALLFASEYGVPLHPVQQR